MGTAPRHLGGAPVLVGSRAYPARTMARTWQELFETGDDAASAAPEPQSQEGRRGFFGRFGRCFGFRRAAFTGRRCFFFFLLFLLGRRQWLRALDQSFAFRFGDRHRAGQGGRVLVS